MSAGHAPAPPPGIDPATWHRAEAAMTAKLLAELAFEHEWIPAPDGPGRWRVDVGGVVWRFCGRAALLDTWRIDPDSISREAADDGDRGRAGPLHLLLDLHAARGLDPAVTALTATELLSTLTADAHLLATGASAADLADLPHLELEGHQTGHPWLVANKGRVGFSAADRAAYAPESRPLLRLPWIAVHPRLAHYAGVAGLDAATLRERELDPGTRASFAATLAAAVAARTQGSGPPGSAADPAADPERYVWLPLHPWQWDEVVSTLFAPQVAGGEVVYLGTAPDRYRPQQSIRTFGNADMPGRFDVKVSLTILNTMVYRGIPTELAEAAPAGTTWLHRLRDADPFLAQECRLVLPGEVAAVAVRHPVLEAIPDAPYRYRQLLGVIWREPLAALLAPGERARTFASLLHVDPAGRAFAAELVARSGLPARDWLARLFDVVLPPLLHLLWRYGLAVNPHGENATIVYDLHDRPVRLAVKDFVDDMKLLDPGVPEHAGLPDEALAVLLRCDADELVGSLAKSVMLAHLRHLAPLCEEQLGVPETEFWALARAAVDRYRQRFPELAERAALLDVTAPTLPRTCLNRERLLPGGYHDRAERDAHFELEAPPLGNPLAAGGAG